MFQKNFMDVLLIIKSVIMGVVEGLTEFLPISSTGHLIVAGRLLAFPERISTSFEIFIQLGAILAVLVFFAKDLISLIQRAIKRERGAINLLVAIAIAFVPAALVGLAFRTQIKTLLFNPVSVSIALILGGIVMLLAERIVANRKPLLTSIDTIGPKEAAAIGAAQVLSLIPGTSRSMTTIMGGLLVGLDRITATRFSFYLSIPTLGIATVYELSKEYKSITGPDFLVFVIGAVVSFGVALAVIRFFLGYIAGHTFKGFGWYRVVAGTLMLLFFAPIFK